MTELEKYIAATVFLLLFLGAIAFLSQAIPLMIERALPL